MYMTMGDRPKGHRGAGSVGRRGGASRLRWLGYLGFPIPVVAAAVPAWYGLSDQPRQAFSTGLLLAGLLALITALAIIIWWVTARRYRQLEVFRLLIGVAILCWGAGQVVSALQAADGIIGYPSAGDLIAFASVPIGLLGIGYLPRNSVPTLPGIRLLLDSLAVGALLTLLLWRVVLTREMTEFDSAQLLTGVFVLADCTVFSAVLLTAVRDLRSRLWPTVLGVLAHMVADLSVVIAAEDGGPRLDPWLAMTLWCLAWPLIGLGIIRFRPSQAGGEGAQDRREGTATQVATLVTFASLLGAVLAGGAFRGADARGSVLLALLIVPVLFLREAMNTHLRLRLTTGLRAQAFRDSLTGLSNRRALTTRIDELERDDMARVVLTLDLDGFKQVNDLLGHHAGDALLIAVADALQENCPPEALIARVGGDEFAVLCPGDLAQGRELGERLRAAVAQALALLAPGVGISASVGVGRLVRPDARVGSDPRGSDARGPDGRGSDAQGGPDATEAERGKATGTAGALVARSEAAPGSGAEHRDQLTGLVESAAALRAAKEGGRDAVQVYDGQVARGRERRLLLEHRLRLAIANRTIITFGQPIVDLTTGRLTGFESLARWTDDELGHVPPDEFIAVAEQTGLVVALGEHLLAETLAAATNAGVFAAGLTLSVNASPIQLRIPGFVELIRDQLDQHHISPDQLIVEITEAILVAEGDPAVSTLAKIHAHGIGLAIDDFGTGYSALGYLRRLPVQVLKIDKSLTSSLLSEAKTLAIVEGVAQMAHQMGIRVVMEGIEEEREADGCRSIGADRGQGYLFGRPTPWAQAAKLVPPAQTIVHG
jgi:diguanylate cyclase (GGDEF)-like protein